MKTDLVERIVGKTRTIVVIGDAIVDRWIHGHLDECQDGCQKFVQEKEVVTYGGASNAWQCLRHWTKLDVHLFALGEQYCAVKTRFVLPDNRIVFRWDEDTTKAPIGELTYSDAIKAVEIAHGVLLSDYDKGFLSPEFIQMVADLCNRRGVPCVADCKRNMSIYKGCILKGNAHYWGSYPIPRNAVATYGHASPAVGIESTPPTHPVPCVNHVGAGDCFAAHLTLALACGLSLREAAMLAHSAGRVYVQHPHNRAPRPQEIAADLASGA